MGSWSEAENVRRARAATGRAEREADGAALAPTPFPPGGPAVGVADVLRLQRLAGNRAVARLLGARPSRGPEASRRLQRMPSRVPVPAGLFDTEYYEALQTEKPQHKVGAAMVLTFTPAASLKGRVGLVQSISQDREVVGSGKPPVAWPMKVDTQVEQLTETAEGWRPAIVTDSPIYGGLRDPLTPLRPAPRALGQASDPKETAAKWTTPAHHSVSAEKVAESEAYMERGEVNPPLPVEPSYATGEAYGGGKEPTPAGLTDIPGFAASTDFARTTKVTWRAEVAALGLTGEVAGKYLGSVRWGWRYEPPGPDDAPRSAALDPEQITLLAEGPSAEFMSAAFAWNTQAATDPATGAKVDLIQLPIPAETMAVLSESRGKDWSRGGPEAVWKRVEEILGTHAKRRVDVVSESELALLRALEKWLRARVGFWAQQAKDLWPDVKKERRKGGEATTKFDRFGALETKETELAAAIATLLKQVRA